DDAKSLSIAAKSARDETSFARRRHRGFIQRDRCGHGRASSAARTVAQDFIVTARSSAAPSCWGENGNNSRLFPLSSKLASRSFWLGSRYQSRRSGPSPYGRGYPYLSTRWYLRLSHWPS